MGRHLENSLINYQTLSENTEKETTKEIILTQGVVALVDKEDFEWLTQWNWCAHKNYNTYYAVRVQDKKYIAMHRVIMSTPYNLEVDHKDGNGLNNQKYNLRNCTHSQNCHNIRRKHSTVGVGYSKATGKYFAQIRANGKRIYLGTFNSEIEAALAYNKAAKSCFGNLARLNQIEVTYE